VRVSLDTNVLVAAFATRGLCADVVRTVLAEHEWIVSETVLGELQRALTDKIGLPESGVRSVVRFVREQAEVTIAAPTASPVAIRDPDDEAVLSDALNASADVLVTGDRDFLDLEEVPGLRILNPRGFWSLATSPSDK
jgi:putative PIN family toxin of toxin-antitoxin system